MNPLLAEGDLSPQIVLAVAFVVFSALKWVYDNIFKKNQGDSADHDHYQNPPNTHSSGLADLYEQYREKIQAAQTEQAPTQAPVMHVQHHTQPTVSAPSQVLTQIPPTPPTPPQRPVLSDAEKAALAHIQANKNAFSQKPKRHSTGSHTKLRRMLDSPAHARQAIIVQEVLGQPKALSHQPQTGPHV